MNNEVFELILKARDEASAALKSVESHLVGIAEKANLGGRALGGLHSILSGIGVGIGLSIFTDLEQTFSRLVGLIPSLIEKGLSFAETVNKISVSTGASAEAASQFAGQLEYLGISTDGIGNRLGMLAKGIKAHEAELTRLGVSIRDASGAYLDEITIVNRARDAISGLGDGLAKTNLARDLFGRSGAGMLEWFNLTNAQITLLNGKLGEMGVIMSEKVAAEAKAAAREGNLLGLAMQGLGNTIMANVVPQLIAGIDSIVNFVQRNGQAISKFASDVVNFVLGMITALTGATASLVPFTTTMNSLAPTLTDNQRKLADLNVQLSALPPATNAAGAAAGGLSGAIKEQISTIDRHITALKAEAVAYDLVESRAMKSLNAQIQSQLDALTAGEKAVALDEQRVSLVNQLADAQTALAKAQAGTPAAAGGLVIDPKAVEAAADQIAKITQSSRDLEQSVKNDARRAELAKITDYLAQIGTAEKETVNKAKLLAAEKTQALGLQSQIAAAQASGDLQAVADLSIKLQGVQTAATRTQAEIRNSHSLTELEAKKASLNAQTAAVGGAVADQTAIMKAGLIKQIADMQLKVDADKVAADKEAARLAQITRKLGETYGPSPTGAVGLLSAAGLAGEAWGLQMRTAIDLVIAKVKTLLDILGTLIGLLDKASLGANYLTDPALQKKVKDAGGIPIISNVLDLLGGLGDVIGKVRGPGMNPSDPGLFNVKPHAAGGWVGLNGPEIGMLGEQGPEFIRKAGTGTGGTGGVSMGDVHIHTTYFAGSEGDARSFARQLFSYLQDEAFRRGSPVLDAQRGGS